MRPEKKEPAVTEDEQLIVALLQKENPAVLNSLKEQTGLSNKKWDKAIKGLNAKTIIEVKKIDDVLMVTLC